MSNSCILANEKETKQGFNYTAAKLVKCNIKHKYSAVEKRQNNTDDTEVT